MEEQSDFSELKNKLTYETTGEYKNIELTDEQYVRLITLLKIGLRVIGCGKDNVNLPLMDIDQYISSYAKQFNADHLVELSETFGLYFCTDILSEEIDILNESYGDDYLHKELSHKLAMRDLFQIPNSNPTKKMNDVFEEIKSGYLKEFEENDLKNLTIIKNKSNH